MAWLHAHLMWGLSRRRTLRIKLCVQYMVHWKRFHIKTIFPKLSIIFLIWNRVRQGSKSKKKWISPLWKAVGKLWWEDTPWVLAIRERWSQDMEMGTFCNGRVTLGGKKPFMNSLDYFLLGHKNSHIHVHPLYTADFQQRSTISIYRHSMSHLQA